MGPLVKSEYPVDDSVLTVKQIRNARPSPDGKRLVFTALDKLWMLDLPNGKPRRLTTSTAGEHSPAWSPDGRWIAYVTWTEQGGDIWRISPTLPNARPSGCRAWRFMKISTTIPPAAASGRAWTARERISSRRITGPDRK
jgi:Tol biopolymer transport system component